MKRIWCGVNYSECTGEPQGFTEDRCDPISIFKSFSGCQGRADSGGKATGRPEKGLFPNTGRGEATGSKMGRWGLCSDAQKTSKKEMSPTYD